METTLLEPSPELAQAVLRRQRITMWVLVVSAVLIVGAVAVAIVAAVMAGVIKSDLSADSDAIKLELGLLLGMLNATSLSSVASLASALSPDVVPACSSASAMPLPQHWLVLGDPFAGGYPLTAGDDAAWYGALAALVGSAQTRVTVSASAPGSAQSATLSQLAAQALAQDESLRDAVASSQPLLVFLSHGYEKLLTRASTADGLYQEVADALASQPQLLTAPGTRVVVLHRPRPGARGDTDYVPRARMDCSGVPGGSVFNAPSSPEQSHSLPLAASSLAATAALQALLSYPAEVSEARTDLLLQRYDLLSSGPTGFHQCMYSTAAAQQVLAQYLATCLSGQPFVAPRALSGRK